MVRHAMDTTYVYVDHRTTYVSDLHLLSVGNNCDNFMPKVVTWRSVRPLVLCARSLSNIEIRAFLRRGERERNERTSILENVWKWSRRAIFDSSTNREASLPSARAPLAVLSSRVTIVLFLGSRSFERESRILTIDDTRTAGGNAWPSIDVNSWLRATSG